MPALRSHRSSAPSIIARLHCATDVQKRVKLDKQFFESTGELSPSGKSIRADVYTSNNTEVACSLNMFHLFVEKGRCSDDFVFTVLITIDGFHAGTMHATARQIQDCEHFIVTPVRKLMASQGTYTVRIEERRHHRKDELIADAVYEIEYCYYLQPSHKMLEIRPMKGNRPYDHIPERAWRLWTSGTHLQEARPLSTRLHLESFNDRALSIRLSDRLGGFMNGVEEHLGSEFEPHTPPLMERIEPKISSEDVGEIKETSRSLSSRTIATEKSPYDRYDKSIGNGIETISSTPSADGKEALGLEATDGKTGKSVDRLNKDDANAEPTVLPNYPSESAPTTVGTDCSEEGTKERGVDKSSEQIVTCEDDHDNGRPDELVKPRTKTQAVQTDSEPRSREVFARQGATSPPASAQLDEVLADLGQGKKRSASEHEGSLQAHEQRMQEWEAKRRRYEEINLKTIEEEARTDAELSKYTALMNKERVDAKKRALSQVKDQYFTVARSCQERSQETTSARKRMISWFDGDDRFEVSDRVDIQQGETPFSPVSLQSPHFTYNGSPPSQPQTNRPSSESNRAATGLPMPKMQLINGQASRTSS